MNEKRPGKRKSNSNNGTTIIKTTGRRDPLHWFGILVSPSLRASQDHFKTGKKKEIIISEGEGVWGIFFLGGGARGRSQIRRLNENKVSFIFTYIIYT